MARDRKVGPTDCSRVLEYKDARAAQRRPTHWYRGRAARNAVSHTLANLCGSKHLSLSRAAQQDYHGMHLAL